MPGSAVAAPWHCSTVPWLSRPRALPLQGPLRFMATITAPARHDLKAIKTFTVSLSPEISLGSPSQGRGAIQSHSGSGWALHKGEMEQVLWPNFSRIARFSYPQREPASETSVPCRGHCYGLCDPGRLTFSHLQSKDNSFNPPHSLTEGAAPDEALAHLTHLQPTRFESLSSHQHASHLCFAPLSLSTPMLEWPRCSPHLHLPAGYTPSLNELTKLFGFFLSYFY